MSFRKAQLLLLLIITAIALPIALLISPYIDDVLGRESHPVIKFATIFVILYFLSGNRLIDTLDKNSGAVDTIQGLFSKEKQAEKVAKPYDLNSSQNEQNRKNIIANVRSGHIDGVLHQALHKMVRIELQLEYDPTALMRQMELWEGKQIQRAIPKQADMIDLFDDSGQTLLILGEPGSGKTISLLELCDDLLKRAEKKKKEPVPVVLNLSNWAEKKGALDVWIVRELYQQYTLTEKVSQVWLDASQMCLLLDGLDEVAADARDECVAKINEFRQTYTVPMMVCSRIGDYEALSNKLHLSTAVVIQPLTDAQVKKYLTDKRLKLGAVYEAVQDDDALRELSRAPLNLNIMALAYGGNGAVQLKPLMKDVNDRRQHLYNAYLVRMFRRRPLHNKKYDELKALHWLYYLATQLTRCEETQFFIEDLRPTWLPHEAQRRQKWLNGLGFGLVSGLVGGLVSGLFFGLFFGLVVGLVVSLVFGLFFGLFFGLLSGLIKYRMLHKVIWIGLDGFGLFFILVSSLFFGLVSGLVVGLFFGLGVGLDFGLVIGLGGLLFVGLVVGLDFEIEQSTNRLRLNQGIKYSEKSGLGFGLFISLVFGLVFGLGFGLFFGLVSGLLGGLLFGLGSGLYFGLGFGGGAVINHYLIRWSMSRQQLLPLRLVPFLNDMATHLLLQNAGAYFRFFHRSMQEHFVVLTPEDIAHLVAEIKDTAP